MNIPLICYRFSGWLVTVTEITLAIFVIKTKRMWRGEYIFMAIYFCNAAVFDIISSVMANFQINNLFFSNILSPLNFTLKALYLRELNKNKYIRWGVVLVIVIFVGINIINSFFLDRFKEINTIGMIINRSFFILFTV